MFFSVIVPVYNIRDWVEKCIDSIMSQTFSDFELILVDDGSTDGSGEICDRYGAAYPFVKVLHKSNGGLSDARNYGVRNAKGEYLLFVDGDDYIADYALGSLADEIIKYTPDVILSEGMYLSNREFIKPKISFKKEKFSGISGPEALMITSGVTSNWSACGKCYRTQFWREHGFAFVKDRLSEDFQLIDRVVLEAASVCMVSAFYYYRYRSDSIVHSIKAKNLDDLLLSLAEWRKYLAKGDFDERLVHRIISLHAGLLCHCVLGYISLLKSDEEKRLLLKTREYMNYLSYNGSAECRMIWISYKLFGLKATCRGLGIIKKRRLKRESKGQSPA